MKYVLLAIGAGIVLYVGNKLLNHVFIADDLYEDARRNRVRVLNQRGDWD